MTTLLGQTLVDVLEQEIVIRTEDRKHIAGFIPYLYLHNTSGLFTFSVIKNGNTLSSKSFTQDDVKTSLSTTDNYIHVFYPIVFDNPLKLEKGQYTLRLEGSSYSPNSASFMAWLQQFEDIQNVMDYLPLTSDQNSLAFRVKEYKEGIN